MGRRAREGSNRRRRTVGTLPKPGNRTPARTLRCCHGPLPLNESGGYQMWNTGHNKGVALLSAVTVTLGAALLGVGVVGFAATGERLLSEPTACSSQGTYGPNGSSTPACPLEANACNDPDGCICTPTCVYWYHIPQKRCHWWAIPLGCRNNTKDYCYRRFNILAEDCATFAPGLHWQEGQYYSCEGHCGASTGHGCT